jgi:hypothetical protein
MSHSLIQRLRAVESEFLVCAAALVPVERRWHEFATTDEWSGRSLQEVRAARARLEGTYIIRLFSEFEGCLHYHLTTTPGLTHIPHTAQALINRVALRNHIPNDIRLAVHQVREYRNSLVHTAAGIVPAMSFRDVRRALNQFLAILPELP